MSGQGNNIYLQRKTSSEFCTIGRLDAFENQVWTLENAYREHPVFGMTRIPAGRYRLELEASGGQHERYSAKFQNTHRGMIWLRNVPLFEHVYLCIGSTYRDTHGCILVGMTRDGDSIAHSEMAYMLIYRPIIRAIDSPQGCYIVIEDEETA